MDEEQSENIDNLLNELEDSLDDVGKIKEQYMSKIIQDDEEFNSSQVPMDSVTKREVQDLIESIPKPMVQKPFQPGSSPTDEDNRFLCWNSIGIMRARTVDEDQSIDVIFHDTEKHSSINFKNEPNYTHGSLSDDAVVVGSNGKYGTGPALIHGINMLESNREQREWEVELPHSELIENLVVGLGFVAVATDLRNLRLFTNGGMQSYVLALPNQILCMNATERQIILIYHNGAGHSDDQNLAMKILHVDLYNNKIQLVYDNIPVALGKRSPIAWAGFSDEGTPCTYDYSGTLRIFKHDLAKSWVPLLDMRELTTSALNHFFVVGVSELSQAVRAVKCRRSRFPEPTAEIAEVFSFSIPLCNMDTDRGKLEEELVRLRLAESSYKRLNHIDNLSMMAEASIESNEKLLVNTYLRLFANFLREDKEELARSLVYMIPKDYMSKLPEFAWKTNRRQYFIDQLNRAMEERENSELKCNKDQDDDVVSVSSVTSHHSLGKDLRKEVSKSKKTASTDAPTLKPIPLDKLLTTNVKNNDSARNSIEDDDSGDENDAKRAKRIKSINYNLFSKKSKVSG